MRMVYRTSHTTFFETNSLPFERLISINPIRFIEVFSQDLTFNAPLQPVSRLNPYDSYETTLTVYSRTNGPSGYVYTGQSDNETGFTFYDFTNTTSPDPSANFLITMYPSLNATYAISNSPGEGGYPVSVGLIVQRV